MTKPKTKTESYDLQWSFVPRIATDHLGSLKYSTTSKAIRELVANSFDAGATVVDVDVHLNQLGTPESITVADDGQGISPEALRDRFIRIGVEPKSGSEGSLLGRLGVGRLAVYRIGTVSDWTSASKSKEGFTRISFTLKSDERNNLSVKQEFTKTSVPLGTTINVFNLLDKDAERLSPGRISNDLLSHFCSFLLGHPQKIIRVQGQALDVGGMIERRESETIPASEHISEEANMEHLMLKSVVDQSRFQQMLFSAKGLTVHSFQPEDVFSSQYMGIVECPYLDSIVTSNREMLIEMDDGFVRLRDEAVARMARFGQRFEVMKKESFIERARREPYYPYRIISNDPVTGVEQAIYDVVLEKLNENVNVDNLTRRQQEVVFRLLKRSLENEDLLEVLKEVAKLSDEDIEKFRKVLEHTTLESIIKLSSEVTNRLVFLEILHKLVYGEESKHLKERSQLHKIIDSHCWVFGPQFHLATSDRSFREIIRKHRTKAGLPDISDDQLLSVVGIEDIPDLFLAASRDFPTHPKHHHVLVEIKAPTVTLARKEVDQIRRYAETILDSHEFDKDSTRWDLFLVSSRISTQVERDRTQKDKRHGCLWEWDSMTVWAFKWSEIITTAQESMQLVKDHLARKSQELAVSDYLRENFPEVLKSLNALSNPSQNASASKQGDVL